MSIEGTVALLVALNAALLPLAILGVVLTVVLFRLLNAGRIGVHRVWDPVPLRIRRSDRGE